MSIPGMSIDKMLAVAMDPLFNEINTGKPRMKTFTQVRLDMLKSLECGTTAITKRNEYGNPTK
jgi:hypothetical protein